ncbi:RagB/SusD family nutrient uptake outer membrane protein [Agriterribacter sp.]|uniref:RagB/SusD family nutrient uptake outer membrane protein n=1 Tax=Agriterribacter sp. TaxID=2821509 RepID=UPI002C02C6ED|nr:RagB/SusD family nutrient uptake outer membrane protein [Agriterribacter sp.]HRP54433.1 RagB/SusD family nutrient uptake outer membrane protein [Agriterribacter sp.]
MKINIWKYSLLLLLSVGVGCKKDFLNKYPLDQITTVDFWKTGNDLKLYVNQFYPAAFNQPMGDQLNGDFAADAQSDDVGLVIANPRLQGSRVVPATGGWGYTNIRALNVFMANYDKVEDPFNSYKDYVGEAYFFRAFFYFNLVKEYGDVPYIGTPLNTNSEELYMPRAPRNQVVDSIIADLDEAIELLPAGKQEGATRLSREIALLFKSRVCLYEGTWEKYHVEDEFKVDNPQPQKYLELAAQSAKAVIESGTYAVYSTGEPEWDYFNLFSRVDYATNPEVLLWEKFDLSLKKGNAFQFQIATGKSGGIGLTRSFVDAYLCKDGRPIYLSNGAENPLYEGDGTLEKTAANRDPRFTQTIFTPGFPLQAVGSDTTYFQRPTVADPAHTRCPTGYQMNKFLNFDPVHHASLETLPVGYTGWIVFRYAEALLNYAEAKAELGTITQQDIDMSINRLRNRVAMPPLDIAAIEEDPNWQFPDLTPVLNEIRRERRVELILEGFRWNDLARWAAAEKTLVGKRPLGAKFNTTDYPDLNASDFTLTDGYFDPLKSQLPGGYGFRPDRDYLSPVSTEELTLNKQLVQNPGW